MSFLVVLDCDGTLVDAQAGIIAAMTLAMTSEGFAPPPALAIRRVVGLSLEAAFARLVPNAEPPTLAKLADHYQDAAIERHHQPELAEPLYPGAVAALDRLQAVGALLGIATGKGTRSLRALLERHGLTHRFVTVKTADDAPSKPAPDMLLMAMAEAGVTPERTMMVGDTSFDMAMAVAARARPIGVGWGYHDRAALVASGARRVLDGFEELPPLAEDFFSR
jgi:phosphoglycolate phosphatase